MMIRHAVARLAALSLALHLAGASGALPAQDPEPSTRSASELAAKLPRGRWLAVEAGELRWRDATGPGWCVIGLTPLGAARIDVGGSSIEVRRELLEQPPGSSLARLDELIAYARAAEVPLDGCVFDRGSLLAHHLIGPAHLVIAEGVLHRETVTPGRDAAAQRDEIEQLAARLGDDPALEALSAPARQALSAILDLLGTLDRSVDLGTAPLLPSLAHHLLRHGWLETIVGEGRAVTDLTRAVREALIPKVVECFSSESLRFERQSDAFDLHSRVLITPAGCRYECPLPEPQYHPSAAPLRLQVTLPPGADPRNDAGRATAVTVLHEDRPVAWWTHAGGFDADLEAWRAAMPADVEDAGEHLLPNWIPPHVPVYDLSGDLQRLVTSHGTSRPPGDAGREERERFLAEAAVALPDAAHLDLLGAVLFRYVDDSPDPTAPALIGSRDAAGEIHQTVAATLGSATGGLMRGDCDDLAELYQAILERQGHLAHVMELPSHNAAGWCTRGDDGSWCTWVLQTGPPLLFTAPKLADALTAAYAAFCGEAIIDPDQLGIALRFSGENKRSSWILGHRIFADAAYARTMIDVQRDWHFRTYHRGIAKMRSLIEGGERDAANLRELAALYASTGQHALAAQWREAALEAAEEVEGRLSLRIQLIADLLATEDPERSERARQLARAFADDELPGLKETLGEGEAWTRMSLANTLNTFPGNWELAAELLGRPLLAAMSTRLAETSTWLRSRSFRQEIWEQDEQWFQTRRLLRSLAGTILGILDEAGPEQVAEHGLLASLAEFPEAWIELVGFRDLDEPGEALVRYAAVAAVHQVRLGRPLLDVLQRATALPGSAEHAHETRRRGLSQLRRDLPWIRASVSFQAAELMRLFERRWTRLDTQRVTILAQRVAQAGAAAESLGLFFFSFPADLVTSRLIAALVAEDEGALRALLREVRTSGDKTSTDAVAYWIGNAARFLEPAWFVRVIALWEAEIDHKPGWFLIAWSAALNRGASRAVAVAEAAVRRHPDDPAFAEEAAFLRALCLGK